MKRLTLFEDASENAVSCALDAADHCLTCSDEAVAAQVLQVYAEAGFALVQIGDTTEEVDTTLLETVKKGDILLVHGGVALSHGSETKHA